MSHLSNWVILVSYVVLTRGMSGWLSYTTTNTSSSIATTTTSTSESKISTKVPDFYSTISSWITTKKSSKAAMTNPANTYPDATQLYQILAWETSLRMEQERTIGQMMKEFEQMKKSLAESKMEQYILIELLRNNVTSLNTENEMLKDDLSVLKRQVINNSFGSPHLKCNVSSITKELQNVKREFRYISISFLDLQRECSMNKGKKYKACRICFKHIKS